MAIILALLAALAYGISDFGAGVASRRSEAGVVSFIVLVIGLICALVASAIDPGIGARSGALLWGAASGLGGGAGTMALYQGLAAGRMTIVATLSAVVAAVVPAIVGLATGDSLHGATLAGIVIAIPAIALVSWHADPTERGAARPSVGLRARGPVLPSPCCSSGSTAPARAQERGRWSPARSSRSSCWSRSASARHAESADRRSRDLALIGGVGVIGGIAGLLFLAATGHGQLAIVAVVTSLYPAFTVLLARVFLAERWSRTQVIGLAVAAAAIVLVSVG